MNHRLLVPYLMGQRRARLTRVRELDASPWEVVETTDCTATAIADRNEQMRSMGKVYARLAARVRSALEAGKRPVSIAGDCISTLGVLAGLQQAGREPQRILWLDAHGDFHTWGTTQTKYLGGMPLAMLVGRPDRRRDARDNIAAFRTTVGCRPYPEQQVLLSDARDLDPGEDEALRNSRVVRCGVSDILPLLSPLENLYLHFDTDVLDAEEEMPALKYHVKSGPGITDIETLFRQLRSYPVVAVSVSAWHAEKDESDRAARICLDLLDILLQE
jgi:arginase